MSQRTLRNSGRTVAQSGPAFAVIGAYSRSLVTASQVGTPTNWSTGGESSATACSNWSARCA